MKESGIVIFLTACSINALEKNEIINELIVWHNTDCNFCLELERKSDDYYLKDVPFEYGKKNTYVKIRNINFEGWGFSKANISFTKLDRGDFQKANFDFAKLYFTVVNTRKEIEGKILLQNSSLSYAKFKGYITNFNFSNSTARSLDFVRAQIKYSRFDNVNFAGAGFFATPISHSSFRHSNLSGANFQWAKLHDVNFQKTNLSGANFKRARLSKVDLRGANLTGAIFKNTDFSQVDLTDAFLIGADLREANLKGVILKNANFTGANLINASFDKNVSEQGAIFSGAIVSGAGRSIIRD